MDNLIINLRDVTIINSVYTETKYSAQNRLEQLVGPTVDDTAIFAEILTIMKKPAGTRDLSSDRYAIAICRMSKPTFVYQMVPRMIK